MGYDSISVLESACRECHRCKLADTRHNVVFGVGPEKTEIMFIGEGPGEQEDLKGEPFVGNAGRFLDEMLSIIGLSRRNCYIANIVKCRPPANRDPQTDEQACCEEWLTNQIQLIAPKIIVCLGRIAATKLIRSDFRITREHGLWFDYDGIPIMATYHPSALLRDMTKRPEAFRDLKILQKKAHELCVSIQYEDE